MNELSNLALFVRVVDDGSFSAAARFLGMLPSSVSRQISQLENELGVRLFHRTTRRQHLTEAGEVYLQHAQSIVADIDSAKRAVSQLAETPSGCLNIAIEADFANTFIVPLLPDFMIRYPEIHIQFLMNTRIVDLIGSGVDIAIRIGELDDSSLYARKMGTSRSLICASPTYIERYGIPSRPEDLSNHNCLSFRSQSRKKFWEFQIEGKIKEININGSINGNNLMLLRNSALAGLGIINIPVWMVENDINSGGLVPLLENFSMNPNSIPIHAVFAHNRHMAPKIRAFIDYLVEKTSASPLLNK